MSLTQEQLRQVQSLISQSLAAFARQKDVEDVCLALIEKHKDNKSYAAPKHEHDISDIRHAETLTKGLAKEKHRHGCGDIDGLGERIAEAVSGVKVPTDYASSKHRHSFADVDGQLPLSRVLGGDKLLLALQDLEELKAHDHKDIREAIKALKQYVDALPKPTEYDDSEIRSVLSGLKTIVEGLKVPTPTVDLHIEPVSVSRVTCEAEYLITNESPEASVKDARGVSGTVRVTPSGSKYVVRGVFKDTPSQPLTFTFSTPPTLCSIGISTEARS